MPSWEITHWSLQTFKLGSRQIKLASNSSVYPQEFSDLGCQACPFQNGTRSAPEHVTLLVECLSSAAPALCPSIDWTHTCALPASQAQGTSSLGEMTQSTPPRKEHEAVRSGWSEGPEFLINNYFTCVITSYKENGNEVEKALEGSSYI